MRVCWRQPQGIYLVTQWLEGKMTFVMTPLHKQNKQIVQAQPMLLPCRHRVRFVMQNLENIIVAVVWGSSQMALADTSCLLSQQFCDYDNV